MRSRNSEIMQQILAFVNKAFFERGRTPTFQEIADTFGMSKSSASRYIGYLAEEGLISYTRERGLSTNKMEKTRADVIQLPIVGSIACGTPILAEENIESYLTISADFLGNEPHFILKAKGESMIGAGISDGDYIVVRKQSYARSGQIVVALIDGEATLKRYFLDRNNKRIRLHPENEAMEDMFFNKLAIQGVAVRVIKSFE